VIGPYMMVSIANVGTATFGLGNAIIGNIVTQVAGKALGVDDKKDVGPSPAAQAAAGTDITPEGAGDGEGANFAAQQSTNCVFVVRPLVVTRGEDAAAGWTCSSSGSQGIGFSIPNGIASGTEPIEQPQRTGSYGVMCSDGCQNTAILQVDEPNISITASPDRVHAGDTTTVTWSSSLPAPEDGEEVSCSVTGPGVTGSGTSGSTISGPIESESTFTLSCGDLEESFIVRLVPSFENL
jgi:hypothetical protein